jgi:hypothetical protein
VHQCLTAKGKPGFNPLKEGWINQIDGYDFA